MVESFSLNKEVIKDIEKLIRSSGFYSSKSEFYRDAVRDKYFELIKLKQEKVRKEFSKKIRAKGYKGRFLSREERIKIANEHLMEHGFQPRQAK
ncbi:MAG: ribbon-helix-helix domain-containing protein [Candidatus Diapherotrites archaeon]